jgi:hypothetical protein
MRKKTLHLAARLKSNRNHAVLQSNINGSANRKRSFEQYSECGQIHCNSHSIAFQKCPMEWHCHASQNLIEDTKGVLSLTNKQRSE